MDPSIGWHKRTRLDMSISPRQCNRVVAELCAAPQPCNKLITGILLYENGWLCLLCRDRNEPTGWSSKKC